MDLVATLSCIDRPGIVHAMTSAILECEGNIIENQQYTDVRSNIFVMRTRFETPQSIKRVESTFATALAKFQPKFQLRENAHRKRALILVSKESHCLRDLIYLHEIGELPIEIPAVISNHDSLKDLVEMEGISFTYLSVKPGDKAQAEAEITKIIEREQIDFKIGRAHV